MRTSERLRKLKEYIYENLCEGREMKTPAPGGDFTQIVRDEPKVYLGFFPTRADTNAYADEQALNTAPSILIMPVGGYQKRQEETRQEIHRPESLGQAITVQFLFTVYEDGVRMSGFISALEEDPAYDMSLIKEGTENGLMTLVNWMDDLDDLLLADKFIPGTDMTVIEKSMEYGLYSDGKYLKDDRPLFQGICTVTFGCHTNEYSASIEDMLR